MTAESRDLWADYDAAVAATDAALARLGAALGSAS